MACQKSGVATRRAIWCAALCSWAAIIGALSIGSTSAGADDRPVITIAVQQIVNSGVLDPLREQSNVGARVFGSLYENLISLDRQSDLSPQPGLAESWKCQRRRDFAAAGRRDFASRVNA